MKQALMVVALVVASYGLGSRAAAQSSTPFHALDYSDHRQFMLNCAAGFECDIQLEAGERVNDGFNAHIEQWDPHIGYSGDAKVTPHLVLRPSVSGLRTNIIVTTTKRTYYLLAISTSRGDPSYYTFKYPDETFRVLRDNAIATQTALRSVGRAPIPYSTPTPSNVARLGSTCVDYDYSFVVDRNVQSDHPPRARPSQEQLPPSLIPRLVCTDGEHTFIEFPRYQEVPSDLPISLAVTTEGDTLIDYTYVASLNRFTVDGVYDSFVLEIGSQNSPLRLRVFHAGRGNPPRFPRPTQINPPADLNTIDQPVVPMRTPLLAPVATARPVLDETAPRVFETTPAPTALPPTPQLAPKPTPSAVARVALFRAPLSDVPIVSLIIGPQAFGAPLGALAFAPIERPIVELTIGGVGSSPPARRFARAAPKRSVRSTADYVSMSDVIHESVVGPGGPGPEVAPPLLPAPLGKTNP